MYREPARHAVDFTIVKRGDIYHLFHIRGERGVMVRGSAEWGSGEDFGHATSKDLFDWTPEPSVLPIGPPGAWDEAKVYAPDVQEWKGLYYMVYTGVNRNFAQRLGTATSRDLFHWEKSSANPIVTPGTWSDWSADRPSAGRDGMLLLDPSGQRHLVYYTATTRDGRACIGLAGSADLTRWEDHGPTYIEDDRSYSSLQSPYVVPYDGLYYLFYSAKSPNPLVPAISGYTRWEMVYQIGETPTGPWRKPANHVLLDGWCCAAEHPTFDGVTYAFYIIYELVDGKFHRGTISDPKLIRWRPDGTLTLAECARPGTEERVTSDVSDWPDGAGSPITVVKAGPHAYDLFAASDGYRVSPVLLNNGSYSGTLRVERGSAVSLVTRSSPYARTGYQVTLDQGRQRFGLYRRYGEQPAEAIQEVPAPVEPGSAHRVKIVWQDEFVDLYLDDQLRIARADYTYREGYLGLHVRGHARVGELKTERPRTGRVEPGLVHKCSDQTLGTRNA